jgi:hypothetical protein
MAVDDAGRDAFAVQEDLKCCDLGLRLLGDGNDRLLRQKRFRRPLVRFDRSLLRIAQIVVGEGLVIQWHAADRAWPWDAAGNGAWFARPILAVVAITACTLLVTARIAQRPVTARHRRIFLPLVGAIGFPADFGRDDIAEMVDEDPAPHAVSADNNVTAIRFIVQDRTVGSDEHRFRGIAAVAVLRLGGGNSLCRGQDHQTCACKK